MMRAIFLACLVVLGCAGSSQALQCRVAAVHKLPLDNPDAMTLGDVKALATDLKACTGTPDGGAL